MVDRSIYAQLSLHVYSSAEGNKPILPQHWIEVPNQPLGIAGFAYAVYKNQNTNEVVISYRGTDNDAGDWLTNFGVSVGQEAQAAQVYARILREHGSDAQGSNITFTGHSLGGGIAATMSVWFNRPAVVFDPAPSERFAKEPIQVANVIDQLGNDAPQAIVDYFANISSQFAAREGNVTSYYVPGSPVRALSTAGNTITGFAQDYPLTFGSAHMVGSYDGLKNLHSQALHTAGVMLPAFRSATVAVQSALPLVMRKELYAEPESGIRRNFLIDLIRSEQANPGNGKLSHFAADLSLLGPVVPTLSRTAQDALIAQCIEWYYFQPNNYSGQQFFTVSGNTLQYTTAQGAALPGAQNRAADYVSKWLAPLANDHGEFFYPNFGTAFDQWNVATGTGNSVANAIDAAKTQLFIGQGGADDYQGGNADDLFFAGAGADLIKGGAGDDRLYGGAGADTLTGGGGDDQLFGGAGTDIYSFAGRFGADTLTGTSAISGTGNALANTLTGNAANNTLSGAEGNDTYVGGAGNDTLVDASTTSADVYTWGLGQGSDTINDAGGADRIDLGTGITAGQLTYSHVGSDLRIGITGQTDTLTVLGWYTSTAKRVETIKLADGSSINLGTSAPLGVSDRSRADYWRGDALQADWAASTTDALLDNQASALVNAMATFRAGAEGISANLAWRRPEPVSWMAVDGR